MALALTEAGHGWQQWAVPSGVRRRQAPDGTHCGADAQQGYSVNERTTETSLSCKRGPDSKRTEPFRKGYDHLVYQPVGSRAVAVYFLWATVPMSLHSLGMV